MLTLAYAAHVAYLDPLTGAALLIMPNPDHDLILDGVSLHDADRTDALSDLARRGLELSEDDSGLPILDGYTADGREVFGLCCRDPIMSSPTIAETTQAYSVLLSLAEVVARKR